MDRTANAAVQKDTMQSTATQRIQRIKRNFSHARTLGKFSKKDTRTLSFKRMLYRFNLAETAFIVIESLQI